MHLYSVSKKADCLEASMLLALLENISRQCKNTHEIYINSFNCSSKLLKVLVDFQEVFFSINLQKSYSFKAGTSVKFRRVFNCPIRVLIDTQTNIHDDIYPLLDLNSVYGDRRNVWPPCLFTWDKGQSIIKAVSVCSASL